ncbi:MAG: hypothetical protein HUJ94_08245 [Bacteroidales bacterium]|nr:hypothetical protein [Bacteroidales bacterium]
MTRRLSYILILLACLTAFSTRSHAQFREEAFTQNYASDTTATADSAKQMFSFKELYGGLAGKQDIRIGVLFAGSLYMPGAYQIYNKDWWKLPVIYGGMGALGGLGGYELSKYKKSKKAFDAAFELDPETTLTPDKGAKTRATLFLAGAGVVYWGSLMDGVRNFQRENNPHPGRATLYSILCPGLGQAYNGEYWKIPIYLGAMGASVHFFDMYRTNYLRYQRIYKEATNKDVPYNGPISADTAKWYRDQFRRYRDYSVLAIAGFYLLQVIDANVFSYMGDFAVDDNIALKVQPTLISPDNCYASTMKGTAVGMRLGLTF